MFERENAFLRTELSVLRAHPDATPHPAALQVSELTLSLRHLSDKLTAAEGTLLERTRALSLSQAETRLAQHALDGARRQADAAHERERTAVAHVREMYARVKNAEEERRLTDVVVREYADLVRELDAARHAASSSPASSSSGSSITLASSVSSGEGAQSSDVKLVNSLAEGKLGLKRLLAEFDTETTRLEDEVGRLHDEMARVLADSEAVKMAHEECLEERAVLKVQLDKLRNDERSVAQKVSRYMYVYQLNRYSHAY